MHLNFTLRRAALLAAGLASAGLESLLAGGAATQAQEPGSPLRVIGYYASWDIYGAAAYGVDDIPGDLLTHINYPFINISEEGECILGDPWADIALPYPDDEAGAEAEFQGHFRQFQLLKERYPHLQTLMSVGGWTWAGRFSDVALTEDSRRGFIDSCLALMTRYGFDGIDLDWEYPGGGGLEGNAARPEDTDNFTALLAEFRAALDAQGRQDGRAYLLTIAAPAGNQVRQYDLAAIHPFLDWLNVMTYDFNGGWSDRTGFNAPLPAPEGEPRAAASLQIYLDAGVPADKVVMGVPFYGRGWGGVPDTNDGLGQPFTRLPGEQGSFKYSELADFLSGMTRYWSEEAQVPWLYNATTQIMISYDDPESLALKAAYVREHGLGGVMIWELGSDDAEHSLLSAVNEGLSGED